MLRGILSRRRRNAYRRAIARDKPMLYIPLKDDVRPKRLRWWHRWL